MNKNNVEKNEQMTKERTKIIFSTMQVASIKNKQNIVFTTMTRHQEIMQVTLLKD